MQDLEDTTVEPFKVTPGFIAFVTVLFLPVVIAIAVYFGAWAVSGDVYAAEGRARDGTSNSLTSEDAAGWKRALVGICPAH